MTQISKLAVNEVFVGFYLLKQVEIKKTNTTPAKDYLDMILSDATGDISAKKWDVSLEEKQEYCPMAVVKVEALAELYNGKMQAKIKQMRLAKLDDGVTVTDFIRAAPKPSDELMNYIDSVVETIGDYEIRGIVEQCVERARQRLLHYPAAKGMHHAYFAGLAYHLVRMLEIGDFVCNQRSYLNPDLLKAGIILHDIAKVEEFDAEWGVVKDYSLPGKLLGHISIASNWIHESALMLAISTSNEKVLALQHLVLSHHNLGEWGSPVQPQLPEAVALHYIDQLDAKLQMVEDALMVTPEGESWTQQVRGLENKAIYRLRGE